MYNQVLLWLLTFACVKYFVYIYSIRNVSDVADTILCSPDIQCIGIGNKIMSKEKPLKLNILH